MGSKHDQEKVSVIRISRGRREHISHFATAAVFLYGVISVDEFVEVFNFYEEEHTTSEEVLLALKRLAKTDDVEYSLSGDFISGPEFQPEFDDYEEIVRAVRAAQRGKPRYLPNREEFLKYVKVGYREPDKSYADLKAYIMEHKLYPTDDGVDDVDGDLMDLHEMAQYGTGPLEEFEYFSERGYQFSGIDRVNEFMGLVAEAHNNTRMYDNNGFTPSEIFEKYERPKLKPLPPNIQPTPFQGVPKVGRNDPCPCGNGLKYKRCHGK